MPRTFLDLPDAAMPHPGSAAHEAAVAAIAQILRDLAPDLVALPGDAIPTAIIARRGG